MKRINEIQGNWDRIVVEGQFLLTSVVHNHTRYDSPYRKLRLEDWTGRLCAFIWENSGLFEHVPRHIPTPVQAKFRTRPFNGQTIADIQELRTLEQHEVTNAAALLPAATCPSNAHMALSNLVTFVESVDPPALRAFLNRTLLDERIADGFLTCKASQRHHHSERGGLLVGRFIKVLTIRQAQGHTCATA